jgi:hypothetical protein
MGVRVGSWDTEGGAAVEEGAHRRLPREEEEQETESKGCIPP